MHKKVISFFETTKSGEQNTMALDLAFRYIIMADPINFKKAFFIIPDKIKTDSFLLDIVCSKSVFLAWQCLTEEQKTEDLKKSLYFYLLGLISTGEMSFADFIENAPDDLYGLSEDILVAFIDKIAGISKLNIIEKIPDKYVSETLIEKILLNVNVDDLFLFLTFIKPELISEKSYYYLAEKMNETGKGVFDVSDLEELKSQVWSKLITDNIDIGIRYTNDSDFIARICDSLRGLTDTIVPSYELLNAVNDFIEVNGFYIEDKDIVTSKSVVQSVLSFIGFFLR